MCEEEEEGWEGSDLVEEAFEHAGSFDRQRSGDADGLLQNHCWVGSEGGFRAVEGADL